MKKEYFIDFLFFNGKLDCNVVFELKAREFCPKDIGQVQMYMQLVNKQVKSAQHNPTFYLLSSYSYEKISSLTTGCAVPLSHPSPSTQHSPKARPPTTTIKTDDIG
ncbi:MAG: DUF1016 domain-containing protein [Candidatus Peribacteria bacterium]|jgi:hypothetical protein|nr:DUF1016 domain-containing protein [Candidatus Peribacteria bacterium]